MTKHQDSKPLDPGGKHDTKGKAARVGSQGFVREDFPGYDPDDFQPELPGQPQEHHIGPRRDFSRGDSYGYRRQDRDKGKKS